MIVFWNYEKVKKILELGGSYLNVHIFEHKFQMLEVYLLWDGGGIEFGRV
jgi:hypothetical protein